MQHDNTRKSLLLKVSQQINYKVLDVTELPDVLVDIVYSYVKESPLFQCEEHDQDLYIKCWYKMPCVMCALDPCCSQHREIEKEINTFYPFDPFEYYECKLERDRYLYR
jgi:hypothetical protein